MKKENFFKTLKEDYRVYRMVYKKNAIFNFFYSPSFKIVLIFRLSQLFYNLKITIPFAYLLTVLNDFLHGVWIGPKVKVGKGFFLGHPRGLVVNPAAVIGDYCSIIQRVTLGGPRTIIGDYVSINAGASIISDDNKSDFVIIGDNCIIGAGAVVLKTMPKNSVIGGVPAKVLKEISSEDNWYNKRKREK